MSRYRWLLWGGLLVGCLVVGWYRSRVYSGPEAPPVSPHFVFVTGGSGPYWQLSAAGARAAADELGVVLTVSMPETEESVAEQTQLLSRVQLDDELQGVAVSPLDAAGQVHQLNRIAEHVPLVTFDSDAPLSKRQRYVGTTNYGAGQESAGLVREAVPDGGEIAIFAANLTKVNNIERKTGFDDALQDNAVAEQPLPAHTVVGYFVDEGNAEKCAQNIRDVLQQHPDVRCLVGMNGHHGPIFIETLQQLGKLGDIQLVVFDAFSETLDGIAEGHIYATLAQDPYQYGFESIRTLRDLIAEKDEFAVLGRGTINFYAQPVRQTNLDDFRQQLEKLRKLIDERTEEQKVEEPSANQVS